MKCPNCLTENPGSATRCDCGYDFPEEEVSAAQVDSDVHADVDKGHKSKGVERRVLFASAILFFVAMAVFFNVLSSLTGMTDDVLSIVIVWPGGFFLTLLVFAVFCGKREGFIVVLVSIVLVFVASALLTIFLELQWDDFWPIVAITLCVCGWLAAPFASRYVANYKNRGTLLWTTLTVFQGWMPLFVLMFLPAKEGSSLEEAKRKLEQE